MKIIARLLPLVAVITALAACSNNDDDGDGSYDNSDRAANRWVFPYMQDVYLWNDELPSSPGYDKRYDKFFEDLLSLKDGKHPTDTTGYYYSSIQRYESTATTRADEDYLTSSFGFDYIISQSFLHDDRISDDNVYAKKYVTVVCVTKGSQAETAGLKRGDHIYKINGSELPQSGYSELLSNLSAPLSGTSSVRLTTCQLDLVQYVTGISETTGETFTMALVTRDSENDKTITLNSSFIDQTPIYYATVMSAGSRTVGYLVYNEFERGGEDRVYDQALIEVFADFKRQGVNELVLDLRYNPGGYVTSCQLLASLIVPASYTNQVFQKNVYNNGSETSYNYLAQDNTVGVSRVYVIATNYSASASEVLLHCLRASGIDVVHIGCTTEGKNVGQNVYTTENLNQESQIAQSLGRYDYIAYIVAFNIKDANNGSYESTGIDPRQSGGYLFYEEFEYELKELGDPEEPMLAAALHHIERGSFPPSSRAAAASASGYVGRLKQGSLRHVKPSKGYIAD